MAFDNVTLFEVNLPNEVFTGRSGGKGEQERADQGAQSGESGDSKSGGRSKGKMLLVLVALVGVGLAVRKLRSGGSDEQEEIEMTYEQPGVDVERPEP